MEQVEGGDLVVNKGNEEKPSAPVSDDYRNLNYVEGLEEAYKLAEANLDALVKRNYKADDPATAEPAVDSAPNHTRTTSTASALAPVTYCPVYMRIQPCLAPLPFFSTLSPSNPEASPSPEVSAAALTSADADKQLQLFFLLLLRDPTHNIVHRTLTQALPAPWLDIPFEVRVGLLFLYLMVTMSLAQENEWVEVRRGMHDCPHRA
jgi:hypothetical protein